MDIHEWNRERLRQLIVEKFDGRQALIAQAVELPPSYISRILSGKKRLGIDVMTKIEERTGQPGWFDSGPAREWDEITIRFANWFNSLPASKRLETMSSLVLETAEPSADYQYQQQVNGKMHTVFVEAKRPAAYKKLAGTEGE